MDLYYPFTYYPFAQTQMILAPSRNDSKLKFIFIPLDEVFIRISTFLPEFKDYYWISNYGRVYNSRLGVLVNQYRNPNGYLTVSLDLTSEELDKLCGNDINKRKAVRRRSIDIHRLVALAFCQNPLNKEFVNHLNGIKHSNSSTNLEWVTPSENSIHAVKHGLSPVGENKPNSNFTNNQICHICKLIEAGYDANRIIENSCLSSIKRSDAITLIYRLKHHIRWKFITSRYNF